jgi:hypothetical protein
MALQQNQFTLQPIQGMLDLKFDPSTVAVEIDLSSAGDLVAGQAVKMVDSAGGVPKVVECALDADDVWGFLNYDIKTQLYQPGDAAEVSFFKGNVMYMTASAAIARNAKVAIVVASDKVVTATVGMRIVGRAYDKAAADGDLIRVVIDLPGDLA